MRLIFFFILCLLICLTGCRTSDDAVSGRFIQKRKYTRGWHVEHNHKVSEKCVAAENALRRTKIAGEGTDESNATGQSPEHESLQANVEERTILAEPHELKRTNNEVVSEERAADLLPNDIEKKKKRKKPKLEKHVLHGGNFVALGSWFQGWWGALSVLNIPAIAISCAAIGLVLIFWGFTKMKKIKNKKPSIVLGILGIVLGILIIVFSIAA